MSASDERASFDEALRTVDRLDQASREKRAPAAPQEASPAQAYLDHLNASRGPTIAVDVGWLR